MTTAKIREYNPNVPVELREGRFFVIDIDPLREANDLPPYYAIEKYVDEVAGPYWDHATGCGYYSTEDEVQSWIDDVSPKQVSIYDFDYPVELRAQRYIHVEEVAEDRYKIWERFTDKATKNPYWEQATDSGRLNNASHKKAFLASIPHYALNLIMNMHPL